MTDIDNVIVSNGVNDVNDANDLNGLNGVSRQGRDLVSLGFYRLQSAQGGTGPDLSEEMFRLHRKHPIWRTRNVIDSRGAEYYFTTQWLSPVLAYLCLAFTVSANSSAPARMRFSWSTQLIVILTSGLRTSPQACRIRLDHPDTHQHSCSDARMRRVLYANTRIASG